MVVFDPKALIPEKLVARRSLTQLNQLSIFTRAGLGDYEAGTFEVGNTVKFRRPKISTAGEYDPRTATEGIILQQPGYIEGELSLEKLLYNGFPIFSSDYGIDTYVNDFSSQNGFAIGTSFDNRLYTKFRTATHAAAGEVMFDAHPPLAIVAAEDNNGRIGAFNRYLLTNAGTALERENVPPGARFALLSSTAKGDYLGEAIPVDAGYVEGLAGGAQLLQNGLPLGQFVPRHGFSVGGSNVIGGQIGVDDLDSAASGQPELAIASATVDNANGGNSFFYYGDYSARTPLGAIILTLTTTGNLQNVAVGHIARIGPSNAPAKAYGVVLRVDIPGKRVWLVPYNLKGMKLTAQQLAIAGTDRFSVPTLPSVNIAMHRESLVYCSREMAPPSEGSGASVARQVDTNSNLVMQIWRGSYDITRFREGQVATLLMGAKITDFRKACYLLSQ